MSSFATSMPSASTEISLLQRVTEYWGNRAVGYSQSNREELAGSTQQKWQSMLLSLLPQNRQLTLLDVGTGPGFLAILMAQAGHKVIAIDATQNMLQCAQQNARLQGVNIEFLLGDAQSLPLENQSVDGVITRNLTWNLEQPEQAYAEWYRVLKNGGRLINFDANWYFYLFDEQHARAFHADRANTAKLNIPDHYANTDTVAMENIARELPLSREWRPQWDLCVLRELGFQHCFIDTHINEKLLTKVEQINYRSTPMFMIFAQK